jgi:coniferyl-aldehyde dehydrogenase
MNAGQTCVAPDYVLVPHDRYDDLVEALRLAANELYPDPTSGDYSAIPSQSAIDRLDSLQTNQRTLSLFSKSLNKPLYDPKLVLSPDLGSRIMREEIFGPLLPVIRYEKPEDAVAIVRQLPPPLVIYWFGKEDDELEKIVQSTASGAVSVNETVLHAGVSAIPLGGLGASGMGRYHGRAGFDAFSYERPVFKQARWTVTHLVTPPYGAVTDRILRWLLR